MEETVAEILETETTETETTAETVQLETITTQLNNIEVYCTYIVGFLIIIFLYGCFKFFSKYLGMFFQ